MSRYVTFASKHWRSEPIGLFYGNEDFRLDDVCDYQMWSWTEHAACRGVDPEIFFHHERPAVLEQLIQLCGACPVRPQCLNTALEGGERGWWGGMSEGERRLVVKDL